jgi:hypothetical protein
MFDQTMFEKILGPVPTRAEVMLYEPLISCTEHAGREGSYPTTVGLGKTYIEKGEYWEAIHWSTYGPTTTTYPVVYGDGSTDGHTTFNQYDRGHLYYSWWAASGYTNNTFRDRARDTALTYLNNFIGTGDWEFGVGYQGWQPHLSEIKQLGLYYADTGSAAALEALGRWGAKQIGTWWPFIPNAPESTNLGGTYSFHEIRIWVRAIETAIVCHICGAPSLAGNGGYPGISDFLSYAEEGITRLLNCQSADGFWRSADTRYDAAPVWNSGGGYFESSPFPGFPWAVRPFYNGLAMNVLILYWHGIDEDARIPPAIEECCTALYTTTTTHSATGYSSNCWRLGPDANTKTNGFSYLDFTDWDENRYIEVPSVPVGRPYYDSIGNCGNDINGLIYTGFAFTYNRTAGPTWKTRCDLALKGAIEWADNFTYGSGGKRVNESYTFTMKALYYLINNPSARTLRLRGV